MNKIGDKNWGIANGSFLFVVGFKMDEVRSAKVGRMEGERYKYEMIYVNGICIYMVCGNKKYTIYWGIFVVCG